MSIKFASKYIAKAGDSVESIARDFRLSSPAALLALPENQILRATAPDAQLDPGTTIHIPPNAGDLLRDRLYALHAVRPLLHAHFDQQSATAERDLGGLALAVAAPATFDELADMLAGMQAMVSEGMRDIAEACVVLADVGRGISQTHIANANDRSVLGSSVGVMTGLYWMVSAQYVSAWSEMWSADVWIEKWRDKSGAEALQLAERYVNTIRSIIVQQADARIRETLALESRLRAEN